MPEEEKEDEGHRLEKTMDQAEGELDTVEESLREHERKRKRGEEGEANS